MKSGLVLLSLILILILLLLQFVLGLSTLNLLCMTVTYSNTNALNSFFGGTLKVVQKKSEHLPTDVNILCQLTILLVSTFFEHYRWILDPC